MHRNGDLDATPAGLAGLDVYIEYSFQALGPCHGGTALGGCLLICLFRFRRFGLTAFTPASRGDPCPVLAVGGEYAVKAHEVNAWFGDQSSEPGHEVKWLEEYVRGAIAPR